MATENTETNDIAKEGEGELSNMVRNVFIKRKKLLHYFAQVLHFFL